MEQKPETGKSTDKTKNACYTSTIKANEKEIREETIMTFNEINNQADIGDGYSLVKTEWH